MSMILSCFKCLTVLIVIVNYSKNKKKWEKLNLAAIS